MSSNLTLSARHMFSFKKDKKVLANLDEASRKIAELETEIKELSAELGRFKNESKFFFGRVAVKRYNPFGGKGGDQSFSLALLDDNGRGFVITSIFLEGSSRIFAKPIVAGKSEYQLSAEEREAIEQAKNSKIWQQQEKQI